MNEYLFLKNWWFEPLNWNTTLATQILDKYVTRYNISFTLANLLYPTIYQTDE